MKTCILKSSESLVDLATINRKNKNRKSPQESVKRNSLKGSSSLPFSSISQSAYSIGSLEHELFSFYGLSNHGTQLSLQKNKSQPILTG